MAAVTTPLLDEANHRDTQPLLDRASYRDAPVIDPDEEPTLRIPAPTMAQIAAQWEADLAEVATSDRPTKRIRAPRKNDE